MTTETAIAPHSDPNRRQDFVLLYDVLDGNPNGDPDAGGAPRIDLETMQGIVTDVAIKRKIRDYVDAARGDEERFKIYIQRESYLADTRERVFGAHLTADGSPPDQHTARDLMTAEFYDIRVFGAVMSMKTYNAGQVRGPVQISFGRSIDAVLPVDYTIGRVALERRGEESGDGDGDDTPRHGTFGSKTTVPYGLYMTTGHWQPHYAAQTGADADDLELLWTALQYMWDLDRSAARGMMACRGLYVFSHESKLGNAAAADLFDRVSVKLNEGVTVPRSFSDYGATIDDDDFPKGVSLTRLKG